jgi:hypothetical protein
MDFDPRINLHTLAYYLHGHTIYAIQVYHLPKPAQFFKVIGCSIKIL